MYNHCCCFALYQEKDVSTALAVHLTSGNRPKMGVDIYDGELYKAVVGSDLLSQIDNISLMINADGIPIFKSSMVQHGLCIS